MTISKAHWDMEGDNVRLSMPFSKVDKERRIVSGFATLDNVDKQYDIVTTEASLDAFKRFRGNIREMHQPTAVGKMVGFKEEKYFDPESKKFFTGVYVSAYVSKGAQGTWEKVLDGTLSGFSIGGKMNEWDDAYDESVSKAIRVIKSYDLVELSLVDNPANQFANIMSIEKVDGVDVVKGDLANTEIENVFWDDESGIVILSEDDSAVSPTTGAPMTNIGFVEKNDNEKTEMIKFLVDSAKGIDAKINKEVSPMTDTTENTVEAAAEDAVVETVEVAPEADADVEKSDVVDEKGSGYEKEDKGSDYDKSEDMEEDETKSEDMDDEDEMKSKSDSVAETAEVSKSDEIVDAVSDIKDTLTSAFSDLAETVKSLHEQVSELKKSLDGANSELSSVKEELIAAKGEVNEFGKRVDAVEADTAFRKSGDLGEIVQENLQMRKSEGSLWGGRFLKTADLFR